MKVLIMGATGMVGQGVLRECLKDAEIQKVVVIGRQPVTVTNPKLKEYILPDVTQIQGLGDELRNVEACFFTLGVSSVGMSEADYRHLTYDLTLNFARHLGDFTKNLTFIYVSGESTDSTEKGRVMWARIKGKTENDLMKVGFRAAYMFRPGYIHPMNGETSKVTLYRFLIGFAKAIYPIVRSLFPQMVTTTENMGRAMINVARNGFDKKVLSTPDINQAAGAR